MVLSDVIHHLILLVKASRAQRAHVFAADVDVVHVIEQVRLHPETLAAAVANEFLDLVLRLRVQEVLFLMVPECHHRRQGFTAHRARILLALFDGVVRVLVADVKVQVLLNFESKTREVRVEKEFQTRGGSTNFLPQISHDSISESGTTSCLTRM